MKTSSKVAMTLMTINEMGKKIGDLKTERERLIEKDKKLDCKSNLHPYNSEGK